MSTQQTPAAPAQDEVSAQRAVDAFVRIFERSQNPLEAMRSFGRTIMDAARETAKLEAEFVAARVAERVAPEAAEQALWAHETQVNAKVRTIAVDPGFDGCPSALFALTKDGTIWQRMLHADPPAWERVPLPPGSAAPPSAHERHLREFRRLVEQQLDPKLVQDLYDMAEEGSAQDTTTTTTTTETTG